MVVLLVGMEHNVEHSDMIKLSLQIEHVTQTENLNILMISAFGVELMLTVISEMISSKLIKPQ